MRSSSDNSNQFNPQIAALAMPQEGEFKAAADGIANVGKVFIDADRLAQESQLNTLRMEEANQSIIAKKNDNSMFSDKQANLVAEKRKNLAGAIKVENENKADFKKQTENGFMDQFKKLIPSQTFIDPNTGKFSEDLYQNARNEFKSAGGWASDNIHLFDGLADGYRKEALEADKTKGDIAYKEAGAKKLNLEAQTVIPEANAKIAQNNSAANLNNVRAELEPEKVHADTQHKAWIEENGGGSNTDLKTMQGRQNHVALGRMNNLVTGYDDLFDHQKTAINKRFIETGTLPDKLRPFTSDEKDKYGGDGYVPVYYSKKVPVQQKTSVQTVNTNSFNDEISRLLNK